MITGQKVWDKVWLGQEEKIEPKLYLFFNMFWKSKSLYTMNPLGVTKIRDKLNKKSVKHYFGIYSLYRFAEKSNRVRFY